jgi:hypothetical protein
MTRRILTARDTIVNPSGLLKIALLDSVSEMLEDTISAKSNQLNELKQELALSEPGKLRPHGTKRRRFDYIDPDTKSETGITRETDLINALVRKEYVELKISCLENDLHTLKKIRDRTSQTKEDLRLLKTLKRFDSYDLDLSRILFSKEQNEWIDEVYTPNPFHKENLSKPSSGGKMLRSKSEAKIASSIESIGLPYRHDDIVRIYSKVPGTTPYHGTYFADFKLPNLLGGITVHEHFGAFQIENYADNSLQRLNDYHAFEIYELPGRPVLDSEFTFSFESDLATTESIRRLIVKMLLPL